MSEQNKQSGLDVIDEKYFLVENLDTARVIEKPSVFLGAALGCLNKSINLLQENVRAPLSPGQVSLSLLVDVPEGMKTLEKNLREQAPKIRMVLAQLESYFKTASVDLETDEKRPAPSSFASVLQLQTLKDVKTPRRDIVFRAQSLTAAARERGDMVELHALEVFIDSLYRNTSLVYS